MNTDKQKVSVESPHDSPNQSNETRAITCFAIYKGHAIDVEQAGSSAQNVFIDGKPIGHVVFPTGAIAVARSVIDAREIIGQ